MSAKSCSNVTLHKEFFDVNLITTGHPKIRQSSNSLTPVNEQNSCHLTNNGHLCHPDLAINVMIDVSVALQQLYIFHEKP